MLSEHRQVDDEHSKIDVFYKGKRSLINREWLKQGRCSKVRWVMPKQDKDIPLSRCPFLFGLVGGWSAANCGVYLVRDCSVRNGSGLVLQGVGSDPRYVDLGHVL